MVYNRKVYKSLLPSYTMLPTPNFETVSMYDTISGKEFDSHTLDIMLAQVDVKTMSDELGFDNTFLEGSKAAILSYLFTIGKINDLFPYLHKHHPEFFTERENAPQKETAGSVTIVHKEIHIHNTTINEGDRIEIKDSVIQRSNIGSGKNKHS